MTYNYKLENLDCANCAREVESALSKLQGIKGCTVNFFALKLNIETESEMTDEFFKLITKTAKRVEPDIVIKGIK